ncbi:unnamed protein product [Fraxinus pennsylvanica]|uniref:Ethylene receptor n=1 Tax=Fraxinus pennsylvanica TaxID=56036 RepID=A0AAD1ZYX7_9LAMI|nr:unnamed protein product [Fraxinus pennsylvanica]
MYKGGLDFRIGRLNFQNFIRSRMLEDSVVRTLAVELLILLYLISISSAENGFPRCNCDEEGFWSVDSILECQKLMLALTIFKFLTALVSFATAITLITLIPLLLKVKVREFMLKKKTWDLGREVGIIKKQKEAGWHVRMLTQEIRKSLDRHTILYTTLVELSQTLDLHNCAVWMPNEDKIEMKLTHELKERNFSTFYRTPIPINDPDVQEIKKSDGVKILDPKSALAVASSGGTAEPGAVAAIRMPMLRVCNFKGGTPEIVRACYTILVLVLPDGQGRSWSNQELEIVKVVADQVAVALSHAAVLEESQLMREKLVEQNRALQQAKQDALMASQARSSFQMVMSNGLRKPMHSILGLLSILQDEENLSDEQLLLVDAIVKTSNVVSTLINDVMDSSTKDNQRFPLEMSSFQLHRMVKQAACLAKCLCVYRGYNFVIEVDKSLPNHVEGDERRVFQVILHMVGNLLNGSKEGGCLTLRVYLASQSQGWNDQRWGHWGSNSSNGYAFIKLEVGICHTGSPAESLLPANLYGSQRYSGGIGEGLSFSMCRKLVQLMQGDIWVIPNPEGFDQSMALVLRFQIRSSIVTGISEHGGSSDHAHSNSLLSGLKVMLADGDDMNRAVTRKLLEKLGCIVSAVSSGYGCLSALGPAVTKYQIVLLDLQMPDLDGFEVTMKIRKFRSHSWPLIIALTASDDEDTRERCIQIGMNGIIQKPGSLRGIAGEIKRVLLQANKILS